MTMTPSPRWRGPQIVRIEDIESNRTYLTRFILFRTPWFGVQIHAIHLPDTGRALHNHPRAFVSVVLRGGYSEQTRTRFVMLRRAGSIHKMGIDGFHRIRRLLRSPTWTLVFVGRLQQEWGFYTPEGIVSLDRYREAYHHANR